ncbi:MAG: metallophosphoesterase [Sporolactobacillus sp.]
MLLFRKPQCLLVSLLMLLGLIAVAAVVLWGAKQTAGAAVRCITQTVYVRHPDYLSPENLTGNKPVVHKLFKGLSSIDFTFGILPDTQFYSRSHPDIFMDMNRWFVDNRQDLHLKYIFHLGDIVNNYNQLYQWKAADRAMRILDQAHMPYGIISGNHDIGQQNDYRFYDRFFGEDRYRWNPWYGGSYENNKGHFDLINVDRKKYIMLAMGWKIGSEEVKWLNNVLRTYRDRTAILYVHDYLDGDGHRTLQGDALFHQVVQPNSNVRIVLNGHRYGAARRIDRLDDNMDGHADRTVLQMLSDYQSVKGGQGYLRLIGFDLRHGRIYVRTFSPEVGRTHVFKKNNENFSLQFQMN